MPSHKKSIITRVNFQQVGFTCIIHKAILYTLYTMYKYSLFTQYITRYTVLQVCNILYINYTKLGDRHIINRPWLFKKIDSGLNIDTNSVSDILINNI